ncbi:MAG: methyltransferase domain-containing protein [Deltaproteobacteria bacterium]|nr:methyltransferase domain-containing protein [Deltaproteobacteria bacterium]
MVHDAWDPAQYQRFRAEREQPFFDLLALVERKPAMRVLDLGCGTGALTAEAHRALGAARTLGVDRSAAMLAGAPVVEGLTFLQQSIEDVVVAPEHVGAFDLVLANASMQWVDDHAALLPRLWSLVAPGGQLAVQMPANHGHPSHTLAARLARDHELTAALGTLRAVPVLTPERYAELLFALRPARQRVRLEVYAHALPGREAVLEWVKGTLLTWYQERLSPALFARFLERYREELLAALPDERPYLYTFPRVFVWAERHAAP